jgi:hypothetical protein
MAGRYTHQVNFEKVFVAGVLKGRRYHDHVRFCDLASAKAYAARAGEVFEPCAGNSAYRMESPLISELE